MIDLNPYANPNQFTDLSLVKKYEISDENYDRRSDTARKWMQREKLGIYASNQMDKSDTDGSRLNRMKHDNDDSSMESIQVGNRCELDLEIGSDSSVQRGIVSFVGEVHFNEGCWIGVTLDEPYGKHDGHLQNHRYFTCKANHGIFVRPDRVRIGDFPELLSIELEEL